MGRPLWIWKAFVLCLVLVIVGLYASALFINLASTTNRLLQPTSSHAREPLRVALLCYMRGGSSFFGEFFRRNPNILYWYEPFDSFYGATYGVRTWTFPQDIFWDYDNITGSSFTRFVSSTEHSLLTEFHQNILSCNFRDIPVETLIHPAILTEEKKAVVPVLNDFQLLRSCVQNTLSGEALPRILKCRSIIGTMCGAAVHEANRVNCFENLYNARRNMTIFSIPGVSRERFRQFEDYVRCANTLRKLIQPCIEHQEDACLNSSVVTYKGIRLHMESVGHFLANDPELKVIHLLRDPRAIVLSRVEAKKFLIMSRAQGNVTKEATFLCQKMLRDVEERRKLETMYPKSFLTLKYEDIALNPNDAMQNIYKFMNLPVPREISEWVNRSAAHDPTHNPTQAAHLVQDIWGVRRTDWTASVNKWRTDMTIDVQKSITNVCREVLRMLDYTLDIE